MKLFYNTRQFSLIFHPLQVIFIHYKSRIATAIRGLKWIKMTMVHPGFKVLSTVNLLRAPTASITVPPHVIL